MSLQNANRLHKSTGSHDFAGKVQYGFYLLSLALAMIEDMGKVQDEIEQRFLDDPTDQSWRSLLYARLQNQDAIELHLGQIHDGLFPSLRRAGRLLLHGPIGDYAFAYNEFTDVIVDGNSGNALGLGIRSGVVQIHGNAGELVGLQGVGGTVIVNGNCGSRAAALLAGADICVLGNAADRAGFRMRAGALVIQGNVQSQLGEEATGGVIYVHGEVESVSKYVSECRMKEPDRLRLSLILARANVTVKAKDFKVFKPELIA